MEGQHAIVISRRALNHGVMRAVDAKFFSVVWISLNQDASPALVVQARGDAQMSRFIGANIDIGQACWILIPKGPPDTDVLSVLRVGDLSGGHEE